MNYIEIKTDVWRITVGTDDGKVTLNVSNDGFARLTADETDELIRALGAARVEISKARPTS